MEPRVLPGLNRRTRLTNGRSRRCSPPRRRGFPLKVEAKARRGGKQHCTDGRLVIYRAGAHLISPLAARRN